MSPNLIDVSSNLKHDVWHFLPDNFDGFERDSLAWHKEVQKIEDQCKSYEKIGCREVSKRFRQILEHLMPRETYHGFNSISLPNTAILLAKSLKFKLVSWYRRNENYKEQKCVVIKVPKSFLKDCEIDEPPFVNYLKISQENADYKGVVEYDYDPRFYPADTLLLHGIDLNLFDDFVVVVPSIYFIRPDGYNLISPQKLKLSFNSKEKVDRFFFKTGLVDGVVLGLKDKKYFFIGVTKNGYLDRKSYCRS